MKKLLIQKILSGGQTGVDRAALDVAIAVGIPHGGWCPKGCIAEDGVIPAHYNLQETVSADYSERTTWNVRDSDGTLIILEGKPTGGTLLTIEVAKKLNKPYLIVNLSCELQIDNITNWITENGIVVLNIAGPRESQCSNIYRLSYAILLQFLIYK